MKHTPTPWAIKTEEADCSYIRIRGTRLGERYKIANVLTPIYDGALPLELNETRANAEFIVRACNSHDDLVALAKSTRSMLQACAYDLLDKSGKERKDAHNCALEYIAKFDEKITALAKETP